VARPTSGKTRWTQLEQGTPSWRTLLVIVVIVAAHVYGWHVTQINLVELVRGLPNMRHIVLGLLTPDLLERVEASLSAEAPLQLGCPAQGEISRQIPTEHGLVGLTVRPACAQAGDTVTVLGEGFPAGKEGRFFWLTGPATAVPGRASPSGPTVGSSRGLSPRPGAASTVCGWSFAGRSTGGGRVRRCCSRPG